MNYTDLIILYEDNHILAVLKPQNLACCPDDSKDLNLLDLIKEYLIKTYNKQGNAFAGLVHRLDRPTGGIMVFAKTSKSASRLQETMKNGEFEKKYFAITLGIPKEKFGTLKHALYKDMGKNESYIVPIATDGAKLAILNYKVVSEVQGNALLSINLITGRSHQARVQLASGLGTPIFGDQKYAEGKTPVGTNLALWATELRFPHPTTKEAMVFRIDPPSEFPWNKFVVPSLI